MKLFILALCLSAACADVSHIVGGKDQEAKIIKQELEVDVNGQYQWLYETENGIFAQEKGILKNEGSENAAQVAEGQASWTSPEGEKVALQYIADENGYQPQGSHIPTPPPIPEAIIRSLEYIRAHPPPPEKN